MKCRIFNLIFGLSLISAGCTMFDYSGESSSITLRISEVGCGYYQDIPLYLEVYNYGTETVDLGKVVLRSSASVLGSDLLYEGEFSLPSFEVPPGAYILLRSGISDSLMDAEEQGVFYISEGDYFPYWTNMGFAELMARGQTVDFVRWGSGGIAQPTSGTFEGTAPGTTYSASYSYGRSIIRSDVDNDTDEGLDWSSCTKHTPGGPNDIRDTTDSDGDGIPDEAEVSGGTYAGVDYYAMGARTGQKDMFIHIAYMEDCEPVEEALSMVQDVFQSYNSSYRIHFDAGTLFDSSPFNTARYNLSGTSHQVPASDTVSLSRDAGTADSYLNDYKNLCFPVSRKPVFHFLLMGTSMGNLGTYGAAEILGNDMLVTLGDMEWTDLETYPQEKANVQASVILHQIGHNMGLLHGGNDECEYKPNYLSVMNPLYVLEGLPAASGDTIGDRYYWQMWSLENFRADSKWAVFFPTFPADRNDLDLNRLGTDPDEGEEFLIGFSRGYYDSLDESSLDESMGIRKNSDKNPVDWDGDGSADETADGTALRSKADINSDGSLSVLHDYNDWGYLKWPFASYYTSEYMGVSLSETAPSPEHYGYPFMLDDSQDFVVEGGSW